MNKNIDRAETRSFGNGSETGNQPDKKQQQARRMTDQAESGNLQDKTKRRGLTEDEEG
jgi:hypothetical protein